MENKIEERISEVLDILNHTKKNITDLIPKKVMNLLKENASKNYKVDIHYEDTNWIDNLPDETIEIIAMLYRDYIADSEERKKLIAEEQEEIKRIKEENKQKYSYDNLFKRNTSVMDNSIMKENDISQNLIPVPEKTVWYKKIINILKSIFVKGD